MAKKRTTKADYGDGSVYQDAKDGSWRAALRLRAGEKPVRRRAATRAEAELKLAELRALRDAGVEVRREFRIFQDFSDYWWAEIYTRRELAPRSQKHTLAMLELHILPVLANRRIPEMTHAEWQHLLNNLKRVKGDAPLAPQTVRHVYTVLKEMGAKLATMHLTKGNLAEGLEVPKVRKAEREPLTPEQVQALAQAIEGHSYAVAYHLMFTLGLRLGEALAVRRTDFNADFTEVHIQQAADYHTHEMSAPKRGSKRRLPVPPRLAERCRAQWERVGNDLAGLLCPAESGKVIQSSNFEKAWRGYTARRKRAKGLVKTYYPGHKEKAGLPDSAIIHDLRSFVATQLEDLSIGQRTIKHILGHGAANVTERYIKRSLPTMRRALEAHEAALWGEAEAKEKTG